MPILTASEIGRLLVVLVITVGATFLAYVGRIDGIAVQAIYLTMVGYMFGFAHGVISNGGPKAGS